MVEYNLENFYDDMNKAFLPLYRSNTRFKILKGGSGSGKSVAITDYLIYRCINERNLRILVVRKVAKTLKDSVYTLFLDRLKNYFNFEKNVDYTATVSPLNIKLTNLDSTIHFIGLDDKEKVKSIAGFDTVFIEEVTELLCDDFDQLNLRIRGINIKKPEILAAFNPVSATHWIKKRFFDNKVDNATVFTTTFKDNKYIDKAYVNQLLSYKETNPEYYVIYALAGWGNLKGRVFNNYKVEYIEHKLDLMEDIKNLRSGLDFGFTNHPSANVLIHINKDKKVIRVLKEWEEKGMSNNDILKKIRNTLGENLANNLVHYADLAEPKSINYLCKKGLDVRKCEKGPDSIRFAINFIKEWSIIVDPTCTQFIREIENYVYAVDKDGNFLNKPKDKDDHLLDAFKYALTEELIEAQEKDKPPVKAGLFSLY